MPIYEFVCEKCGHVVERLQKLTDPPPAACPECGAKMAKIMSRNSFQLKGGGWYKDLYASASSNGGKDPSSAAGATSTTDKSSTPAPAASATPAASAPASAPSGDSSAKPSAPAPAASAKPDAKT